MADHIFPVITQKSTSLTPKGEHIALIATVTQEVWRKIQLNNKEDIITSVCSYINNMKQELEADDEEEIEKSPMEYQMWARFPCMWPLPKLLTQNLCSAIDRVDDYLRDIARYVMKETGLCSSFYIGGMLPYHGGKIFSTR